MSRNKKFKIISSLEDDAPFGDVNWCTISFLTPQKVEATQYLEVKGFKVHNGYGSGELANDDAKKIKERNGNHDVYLSQIGKIYAWDDATKTDAVEYDDNKLNELEKTRRENIDKIKLMSEQFKNEYKTLHANVNTDRLEAQKKRIQKKLYEKGLITKEEYDLMQDNDKKVAEVKEIAVSLEKMRNDIEECFKTDYLDENPPVALKYGCMSVYSPKHIGGLKTLCFKIRGLFQTPKELQKRINQLEKLYPNDRIYHFEIGKWCPYSENDGLDYETQAKQLNYAMKCYLDNLSHEKEEFEKRKDSMQKKNEQEAKLQLAKNRREKRNEKRNKKKEAQKSAQTDVQANVQANTPTDALPQTNDNGTKNEATSLGNPEDDAAIQKILEYIDDDELKEIRNKFAVDKSTLQTMEVDVSGN